MNKQPAKAQSLPSLSPSTTKQARAKTAPGAVVGKNPEKNFNREIAEMKYIAGSKNHPKSKRGGIVRKPTAQIRYPSS